MKCVKGLGFLWVAVLAAFFALSACDDSSSASSDETSVSSSSVESPDSSVTLSGASAESNGSSNENMEKDKSSSSVKGSEPAEVSSSSAKETKNSSDSKSSSSIKSGDSSSSKKDVSSSSVSSSSSVKSSSSSTGKVESSSSSLNGFDWNLPKEAYFNPDIDYGEMTDERDGKVYRTVTIDSQTWMAENLNYADSVKSTSLKGKSWCYNDVAANCNVAGRLYTWAAAMDSVKTGCGYGSTCSPTLPVQGICPTGWHLPSSEEWNALFTAVGGSSTAGQKLKSATGWKASNGVTNEDAFAFSAIPAGSRHYDGGYGREGYGAYFWNSAEKDNFHAYYMYLHYSLDYAYHLNEYHKIYGFSVRCVKDSE